MTIFRDEQKDVLNYRGGIMAIPSVPGSGKTFILTHLSIQLKKHLKENQKILLLTYMNSAVENFYIRINHLDKNFKSIDVKTIHKFSFDIIKENIDLLNIPKDFSILDKPNFFRITNDLYKVWFFENKTKFSKLFINNFYDLKYEDDFFINLKITLLNLISRAKIYGLKPENLVKNSILMELFQSFYKSYESKLNQLSYLDYDDLLYYAYKLLKLNKYIRDSYKNNYPFILEDESQDSNIIQNKIIKLITNKNLVKVGDSNQNITGTFAVSPTKIFRNFCKNAEIKKELKISNRNSWSILTLSNLFIRFCNLKHPTKRAKIALKSTVNSFGKKNDSLLGLSTKMLNSLNSEFLEAVDVICSFNKKYPEKTIGILCPRNQHLQNLSELLSEKNIEFEIFNDFINSNIITYKKLSDILSFVENPNNKFYFITLLENYLLKNPLENCIKNSIYKLGVDAIFKEKPLELLESINKIEKLLDFSLNSKEKTLIYISENFEFESEEKELIQNIVLNLKSIFKLNPKWSYKDLIYELKQVENNKFNYFNWGESKKSHKNKNIVLTTYHKSKGHEWDMVYLMGLNEEFFPLYGHKPLLGEKSYLKYPILEAQGIFDLKRILNNNYFENPLESYKLEKIQESMRVIYVGITRAKEYLVLSSSSEGEGTSWNKIFNNLVKKVENLSKN